MTYLVIYLAGAGGAVYLDVEGSLKLKPDKNRINRINKVLSYLSGVGSLIGVIDLEALSAIGI